MLQGEGVEERPYGGQILNEMKNDILAPFSTPS
jgi:hypothetical protein